MKTLIKITILTAAFFVTVQINAQTVLTANSSLDELLSKTNSNLSSGSNVINLAGDYFQEQYIQNFSYYDNPEISKLENEVNLLGNVFTREKYGRKNYTSLKYSGLTDEEKKNFRNAVNSYSSYSYSIRAKKDDDTKDKTLDQQAEEFFNNKVSKNLNSDGSVNKQKLFDEIKKKLETLFEMKEAEKQKEVTKLENQLKALQGTLAERKRNKQQIIDQKMNDLVGLPNTLRW
jgi:hypothetical protein